MRKAKRAAIVAIALVLAAGILIYSARRSGSPPAIVGVVRATEIRVEPEVNGQLVSIGVKKGAAVKAGDKTIGTMGSSAKGRGIALLRLDRVEDARNEGTPITTGGVPIRVVKPQWARFEFPDNRTAAE